MNSKQDAFEFLKYLANVIYENLSSKKLKNVIGNHLISSLALTTSDMANNYNNDSSFETFYRPLYRTQKLKGVKVSNYDMELINNLVQANKSFCFSQPSSNSELPSCVSWVKHPALTADPLIQLLQSNEALTFAEAKNLIDFIK